MEEETMALQYGAIVVIDRDGQERDRFAFLGKALIGRTEACDVRINLPYVSRKHAFVSVDENGGVVLDNLHKDSNMTLVNGEAVSARAALRHGDIFTIVDRRFKWLCSEHVLKPESECITAKRKTAPLAASQAPNQPRGGDAIDEIFAAVQPKAAPAEPARKPAALPTPLRKAIQGKAARKEEQEEEVIVRKKGAVSTPLRAEIDKRRNSVAATAPAAAPLVSAAARMSVPTPLRKAIELRRKSAAAAVPASGGERAVQVQPAPAPAPEMARKAAPTPLRKAVEVELRRKSIAAAQISSEASAPAPPSLSEPSAPPPPSSSEANALAPLDAANLRKAAPTPLRKAIELRRKSVAAATSSSEASTPAPPSSSEASAPAPLDPAPLRKAAPTPLRKAIELRRKSAAPSPAPAVEAAPVAFASTEAAPGVAASVAPGVPRKAVPTPLRMAIEKHRKDATAVVAAEPETAVAAALASPEPSRKAVPTPLRKAIELRRKSAVASVPSGPAPAAVAAAAPASAVLAPAAAASPASPEPALEPARKAKAAPTPLRKAIESRRKSVFADPDAATTVAAPARQTPAPAGPSHIPAPPVSSAAELSSPSTTRESRIGSPKLSVSTPPSAEAIGVQQDARVRASKLATPLREAIQKHPQRADAKPKAALPTPLRQQIRAGKPVPMAMPVPAPAFSALPASAKLFLLQRVSSAQSQPAAGASMPAPEGEVESQQPSPAPRTRLEKVLLDNGADPSRYADWSVDELEQRVRSLCMADDMVPGETLEEEAEAEEEASTPQRVVFRGKHTEFPTPSASPAPYKVHWTYSDYEGSVGGESTSTADAAETPAAKEREADEVVDTMEGVVDAMEDLTSKLADASIARTEQELEPAAQVGEETQGPDVAVDAAASAARRTPARSAKKAAAPTPSTRRTPSRRTPSRRTPSRRTPSRSAACSARREEEEEDLVGAPSGLAERWSTLTVPQLKALLKARNADTKGRKAELVDRLAAVYETAGEEERREILLAGEQAGVIMDNEVGEEEEEEEEEEQGRGDAEAETARPSSPSSGALRVAVIPSLLKVAELKALLVERGVEVKAGARKAELAALLQAAFVAEEQALEERSTEGELFLKGGHDMLWRPVCKVIEGEQSYGVVVGVLPPTEEDPYELFRVRLLDGEVEDMERDELDAAAEAFANKHP